jgi:hypothetical protein
MDEQANRKTASGSGSETGGNGGQRGPKTKANYDVPIPRPSEPLGFRGVRHKRSGYESQTRRRQDN